MPASKFSQQKQFYLPNSIFLQTITGDWVDLEGNDWTEPDMVLRPDLSTCHCCPMDSRLDDPGDSRCRTCNRVSRCPLRRATCWPAWWTNTPGAAGSRWLRRQMEFFLVAPNVDPNMPIEPPIGRTGRPAAARQAYSLSAVDEYGPVIDDIYDFAEAQGLEIDGILQEGGAGQIELNLRHGDPVRLADEIFFFKRMIREAALRHGCMATFMAKPIQDEPGSAMHIHHSGRERKDRAEHFLEPRRVRNGPPFCILSLGCRSTCPARLLFWPPT